MNVLRRSGALWCALIAVVLLATAVLPATADARKDDDAVVIANRGSGDISVVNTRTLDVQTFDLPGEAEPMYVNHDRRNEVVYVGDRASSTVVVLDDASYDVVDTIAVGDGVFHQWYDKKSRQLWVIGDTSQTVTVINADARSVQATIAIPADLVARGARPHDVFVAGNRAFVSVLGLDDGTGVVLQYSTRDFTETGRVTTGGDPHLFVTGNTLYVASQDGSSVSRYHAKTLEQLGSIGIPAAHGIYITNRNEILVTNIAGGGANAVWELNKQLTQVQAVASTEFPTPHNLTVDRSRQAWVTHSGATADQVSIIDLNNMGFGPIATVTVGTNPFGLGFVQG